MEIHTCQIAGATFLNFALHGSLEALGSVNIISQGAPTISTPGKPNPENCVFLDLFDVSNPNVQKCA